MTPSATKHFPFIKYTSLWFFISIALLAAGLGSMVYSKAASGTFLNLGIDFAGGTLIELRFNEGKTPSTEAVEASLERAVPDAVSQISVTDQNTYLVQARELSEEQLGSVRAAVTGDVGSFELLSYTTIGPKVGATLKNKALTALILASVAIVLYIAFAFRHVPQRIGAWRFGLTAIVALLHDVLTTVGFYALFRYEVDALFITALLTVMGFSVHDTIVVFDRIRENLKHQTRDESFADVADASLNQTLARSLNTSISTLIPLVALYLWGAASIHHFIFALIFGITVGTYSSIFIATPLLVLWNRRAEAKRA